MCFSHSLTRLDGFAALQTYSGGNRIVVTVSDSGLGIMETLRPSLREISPELSNLSDVDLLVAMFRQGVSRYGVERGDGLRGSAAKALKFNARLDVRLPGQRVLLVPAPTGGTYVSSTAHRFEKLPLMWGTHIAFTFKLRA